MRCHIFMVLVAGFTFGQTRFIRGKRSDNLAKAYPTTTSDVPPTFVTSTETSADSGTSKAEDLPERKLEATKYSTESELSEARAAVPDSLKVEFGGQGSAANHQISAFSRVEAPFSLNFDLPRNFETPFALRDHDHLDDPGLPRTGGLEEALPGIPRQDYPIYAEIPRTGFDCKAQELPGYYADPGTQCQVFWMCQSSHGHAFLCPNGTVFNQEFFVCDWWYNVDCSQAESLYGANRRLYEAAFLGDGNAIAGSVAETGGRDALVFHEAGGFDSRPSGGFGAQFKPALASGGGVLARVNYPVGQEHFAIPNNSNGK